MMERVAWDGYNRGVSQRACSALSGHTFRAGFFRALGLTSLFGSRPQLFGMEGQMTCLGICRCGACQLPITGVIHWWSSSHPDEGVASGDDATFVDRTREGRNGPSWAWVSRFGHHKNQVGRLQGHRPHELRQTLVVVESM
ncbi:hypothetical protein Taro_009280, partial [Colocasia esculenta]|nr:hypothetical protein [Colocasia esculenta]